MADSDSEGSTSPRNTLDQVDPGAVGGLIAVERAVALAQRMGNPPPSPEQAAAKARRVAAELLAARDVEGEEDVEGGGRRAPQPEAHPATPPRVPPAVARAAAAASPQRGSGNAAAAAAVAKARAYAMQLQSQPAAAPPLTAAPKAVRVSGLEPPAQAMNGRYAPRRRDTASFTSAAGWEKHKERTVYIGAQAVRALVTSAVMDGP